MIKVVKAQKSYSYDIGDVICDWFTAESSHYLVNEEGPGTKKIIPLACVSPNPWHALKCFDIDTHPIEAKYECPYTKYIHYAIVPVALLINGKVNVYKDVKHHSPDYVLDWQFHKQMFKDKGLLDLFPIQRFLLGSGYTCGTSVMDGNGSHKQRRVMLDNGDALWVYFHEWYNK